MNHSQQKGAGLIEILVTVLILSTSLLTLAAMQTRSLQYNHSAYLRSQANILAYDILDRVRINRPNFDDYSLSLDDAKPTESSSLAQRDLSQWRTLIEDTLPGGKGAITCNGSRVCTVTIGWAEQNSSGDASEDSATFTYTTRI